MLDLNSIKPHENLVVSFKDGDGTAYTDSKGEEVGVLVTGPTTPEHVKAREKMFKDINRNAELPKSKQDKKVAEKAALDFMKAVCIRPHNFTIGDLKDKDAMEAFLTQPEWKLFYDSVFSWLMDTKNFLKSA